MKAVRLGAMICLAFAASQGLARADDIKVTGMHNCCGGCCKIIVNTLSKVEGVSNVQAAPKNPEVTFEAADARTARRALGALARAGFYGKVDKDGLRFRPTRAISEGATTRLKLNSIHNCCGMCCKAIKGILAKVDGVESETVKPKEREFVVEGNFDGQALVKALNDAGFSVRNADAPVRKRKRKKADN